MIMQTYTINVDPRHVKALLGLIQRMPLTDAEGTLTEDIFGNWFNQINAAASPVDQPPAQQVPADASAEHAYAVAVEHAEKPATDPPIQTHAPVP